MRVLIVSWPFGSPCDDGPPDSPMSAIITVPGNTEDMIARNVAIILASELRYWYRVNRNDACIDLAGNLELQIKIVGFDPRAMQSACLQLFGPDLTCHLELASGGA